MQLLVLYKIRIEKSRINMDDASRGVEMRRTVTPGLLEGYSNLDRFALISSSSNTNMFVSLVDLDEGDLIINYSVTARVVDDGEVVEDTKELCKRYNHCDTLIDKVGSNISLILGIDKEAMSAKIKKKHNLGKIPYLACTG